MIDNVQNFKKLKKILPEKSVVFNVRAMQDDGLYYTPVEAMFYSGAICYSFNPTEEQVQLLKDQGYHVAILTHLPVPAFMQEDDEVEKIDGIEIWYDL